LLDPRKIFVTQLYLHYRKGVEQKDPVDSESGLKFTEPISKAAIYLPANRKEHQMDVKKRRSRQVFGVVAVIGLLFVVGCASSRMNANISGEKIFQAEKTVSDAKESNAVLNATDDIAVAQEKLAKAKDAFGKQNYEEAANMAEQASVDADYARAKATTVKNRKMADEMKKNIDTLRQEIERMSK